MTDLDTALRAAEALRNISDQLNGNDARTFDESDIKAVIAHVDAQQKWAESLMRQVQYAIRRFEQAARERDALQSRAEWLLVNGGLLNEWAKEWRPDRDGTLIDFLRQRIDKQLRNAND